MVNSLFPDVAQLVDLFVNKKFSECGSAAYVKEQETYMFFRDLMEEMEGEV